MGAFFFFFKSLTLQRRLRLPDFLPEFGDRKHVLHHFPKSCIVAFLTTFHCLFSPQEVNMGERWRIWVNGSIFFLVLFCFSHEINSIKILISTASPFWTFTPLHIRYGYFQNKLGCQNSSVLSQTIFGNLDMPQILPKKVTQIWHILYFPILLNNLTSETLWYSSPCQLFRKALSVSHLHLKFLITV